MRVDNSATTAATHKYEGKILASDSARPDVYISNSSLFSLRLCFILEADLLNLTRPAPSCVRGSNSVGVKI
jgi:hypothetical protein